MTNPLQGPLFDQGCLLASRGQLQQTNTQLFETTRDFMMKQGVPALINYAKDNQDHYMAVHTDMNHTFLDLAALAQERGLRGHPLIIDSWTMSLTKSPLDVHLGEWSHSLIEKITECSKQYQLPIVVLGNDSIVIERDEEEVVVTFKINFLST